MSLTADGVKKVAKLANLPITSEEEERYSQQLSKIIDYIELLNQVETIGVEPTFNITGLSNVMQPDEVFPSLDQKDAIKNAKATKDGYFVTKGVFEDE